MSPDPIVHLELPRAAACYTRLFGWRMERIDMGAGSYHALELGDGIEGGIVECEAERALWLPYVEVPSVTEATRRARELGAAVPLAPRKGPVGWRSRGHKASDRGS
jgi:predicted enzyme related to lactoylglutathione lyase